MLMHADHPEAASGALASLSLLVVEDDTDTLALYERVLRSLGARVQCARSVDDALAILTTWMPDVVLCDLHLPHVDGYSLIDSIRTTARLRSVPVIAISGSHPALERDRALRAGFSAHLAKPAKLIDIVTAVTDAVRS